MNMMHHRVKSQFTSVSNEHNDTQLSEYETTGPAQSGSRRPKT